MENQQALDFACKYSDNGIFVITAIVPDGATQTVTFNLGDPNDVDRLGGALNAAIGKKNIYFHVNPVKQAVHKKATKKDISHMAYVHVDIDCKDKSAPEDEKENLLKKLKSYRIKPSIIVDSGGGYQAFWKLKEPVEVTEHNIDYLESLNRGVEHELKADACHNIDRIMRLPGTINLPNEKKRKAGRENRPAVLLEFNDLVYSDKDFPARVDKKTQKLAAIDPNSPIPAKVQELIKNHANLKRRWAGITDGLNDESRSGMEMSVSAILKKAGCTPEEVAIALNNFPFGRNQDYTVDKVSQMFEKSSAPATGDLFNEYVYCLMLKRFISLEDMAMYDKEQFDDLHAMTYPLENMRTRASRVFMADATSDSKVLQPVYKPGKERIIKDGQHQYINLYEPPNIVRTPCDVKPWLDHMDFILPDSMVRETVLDWMAFNVQYPGVKINWSVFIGGEHGIGKDTMAEPLAKMVGVHNTRVIAPADLTGPYNDWMKNTKLIVVPEMAVFGSGNNRREVANRMKQLITTPPHEVSIHEKFLPLYKIDNIVSFLFFSNYEDAILVEKGDRRYFMYWSPAQAADEEYYANLHDWMDIHIGGIYDYMMSRDLSQFRPKKPPPMTAFKEEMIEESRTPLERWLRDQQQANEFPMNLELVVPNHLMNWLPKQFSNTTPRALASALKRIGAKKMGHLLAPDGRKPIVWALTKQAVIKYQNMDPGQLHKKYEEDIGRYVKASYNRETGGF